MQVEMNEKKYMRQKLVHGPIYMFYQFTPA